MPNKKPTFVYELLMLIAILFWGATFALTKPLLSKMGVFLFISIRFGFGGTILAVFLILIKRFRISRQTILGGLVTGALFLTAYILHTYGLKITTASKNAFIVGTIFVFVPFILLIFRKLKQKREIWISVIIALVGLALLTLDSKQGGVNIGDIITTIGTIIVSFYVIKVEDYANNVDSMTFTAIQLMVIGFGSLIIAFFTDDFNITLTTTDLASLSILVLGCTTIAYLITNHCQKYVPSTRAALIYTFEPVFGAIFAWIFLSEQIGVQAIVGMVIIIFAAFYPAIIRKITI